MAPLPRRLRRLAAPEARSGRRRSRRNHCTPLLQRLEERAVPASSITILPGAAGSGSLDGFLSATDGRITTADGGAAAGAVSTGALAAVGDAVVISITVTDAITVVVYGGALALQTGTGRTARFVAQGGGITFANPANTRTTSGGNLAGTTVAVARRNSAGGDNFLAADVVTLNQPINAGSGRVTLQPITSTLLTDLGTAGVPGSTFDLTDADLGRITAGVVQVGSPSNTGAMIVRGASTRHAGFDTLALVTGAGVTQTASLSVADLRIAAGDSVIFANAGNDADTPAAAVTGAGNGLEFTDAGALAIGLFDGVGGINAASPSAIVAGGTLTLHRGVVSAGTVALQSGGALTQGGARRPRWLAPRGCPCGAPARSR